MGFRQKAEVRFCLGVRIGFLCRQGVFW